jgi:hypothetical protein
MLIGITPWQRPGETGAKTFFRLFALSPTKGCCSSFSSYLRVNARKKQVKIQKQAQKRQECGAFQQRI